MKCVFAVEYLRFKTAQYKINISILKKNYSINKIFVIKILPETTHIQF